MTDVSSASIVTEYDIHEHYSIPLGRRQASAICAPMERDDRLTWSVKEYISSFGKDFVISKIVLDILRAFLYTIRSLKLSACANLLIIFPPLLITDNW